PCSSHSTRSCCSQAASFRDSSPRATPGWRSPRHFQVVSSVPWPSGWMAPPSSAKSIACVTEFEKIPISERRATRRSSSAASNLPPQPVKRKSSRWNACPASAPSGSLRGTRVMGPVSRSQVSLYGTSTKDTRSMSMRADESRARAYASMSSSATQASTGWKRVIAATSAMKASSTSASRSAQSVPACGHASRIADWGSHSAGKRSAAVMDAGSADRRLRPDFVRAGLVLYRVDHLVALEIHGEPGIAPAMDHRPCRALAAPRLELCLRRAVTRLDLGHAHATGRQGRAVLLLHPLDQQGVACGRGSGDGGGCQRGGDQESVHAVVLVRVARGLYGAGNA